MQLTEEILRLSDEAKRKAKELGEQQRKGVFDALRASWLVSGEQHDPDNRLTLNRIFWFLHKGSNKGEITD